MHSTDHTMNGLVLWRLLAPWVAALVAGCPGPGPAPISVSTTPPLPSITAAPSASIAPPIPSAKPERPHRPNIDFPLSSVKGRVENVALFGDTLIVVAHDAIHKLHRSAPSVVYPIASSSKLHATFLSNSRVVMTGTEGTIIEFEGAAVRSYLAPAMEIEPLVGAVLDGAATVYFGQTHAMYRKLGDEWEVTPYGTAGLSLVGVGRRNGHLAVVDGGGRVLSWEQGRFREELVGVLPAKTTGARIAPSGTIYAVGEKRLVVAEPSGSTRAFPLPFFFSDARIHELVSVGAEERVVMTAFTEVAAFEQGSFLAVPSHMRAIDGVAQCGLTISSYRLTCVPLTFDASGHLVAPALRPR